MFKFFRLILIVLSVAAAVLSVFAITGSYKNESYLTKTYLLNVHLNKMNLTSLINTSELKKLKRADLSELTSLAGQLATATTMDVASYTSALSSATSSISQMLSSVSIAELGLSDTYSISYWGYCRGHVQGNSTTYSGTLGSFGQDFDNTNINYTWCSDPKVGYKFDPVEVFKNELNNTLQLGVVGTSAIDSTVREVINYLVENITYESLNWPGNLQEKFTLFNNLVTASFGLLLAGAVLAFVSVLIQVMGCFIDPSSCCLSFLNFLYEVLVFVVMLVGSILITFTMAYTRGQVNDATEDLGIKSYLSINFYAFAWSAAVAAFLCLIFNLLGHCCGLFGTNKRNFRPVNQGPPPMAYDHFDTESSVYEKPSYSVRSGMPSHHTSHH